MFRKILLILSCFISVSPCYAYEEILIKCAVKETVSGRGGGKSLIPESQNTTIVYKFFKERVEDGKKINDFSVKPPIISDTLKKEIKWVVDRNGFKIIPLFISTTNADYSSQIEEQSVYVDETLLNYNTSNTYKQKDKKNNVGQTTSVSINRISGILKGETIDFDTQSDTNIHTEYFGKCDKAEKKF